MNDYGPVIAELLAEKRLAPLGPGTPNRALRPKLDALTVERAFAHAGVHDRDMAAACCAGLWLYHDFLDEAHTISQAIDTPSGSFWHALLHRREPDFANSKYWFRRVGRHPVFAPLRLGAADLARAEPHRAAAFLCEQAAWDPFASVDLCEASLEARRPCTALCQRI